MNTTRSAVVAENQPIVLSTYLV